MGWRALWFLLPAAVVLMALAFTEMARKYREAGVLEFPWWGWGSAIPVAMAHMVEAFREGETLRGWVEAALVLIMGTFGGLAYRRDSANRT